MDNGPFRVQRPASRPVSGGSDSAPRAPEEPRPPVVNEEPKKVHRPNTQSRFEIENKGRNKLVIAIIGVVIAIVLGVIGWFAWTGMQGGATAIDSSKYQAVFFTNGQVYFGKLAPMNSEYMKLTDVYYLQTQASEETDSDNPQQASADQNANPTLIKLGDEIHGPEDEMIISKDQILFYENLKTDGKVSESISKFKNPN